MLRRCGSNPLEKSICLLCRDLQIHVFNWLSGRVLNLVFLVEYVLFIVLVFCVVFLWVLLLFVLCLGCPMMPVSLDCPFLIASSVSWVPNVIFGYSDEWFYIVTNGLILTKEIGLCFAGVGSTLYTNKRNRTMLRKQILFSKGLDPHRRSIVLFLLLV
jgi:hypothetical protein